MLAALLLVALNARAATDIRQVDGGASVFLSGAGRWIAVSKLPYGLRPGDQLRLKPLSSVRLELDDGGTLTASQDATLELEQDDDQEIRFRLRSGALDARIRRFRDRLVEIATPRGLVELRADRASIRVDRSGAAVIEVRDGLAQVTPAVGAAVQVPDGYRLELVPGKPAGEPVPQKEFQQLQKRWQPAPDGANRRLERRRPSADPDPDPLAPEIGASELGPESLGLPAGRAQAPALGDSSLGLEPSLGPASLGLKDTTAPRQPPPSLGPESLGLTVPGPPNSRRAR